MKVKPFYIRITDNMTPQMVQDAFDKCHNLGVRASNNDDIENLFDWNYFGVCAKDGTYLSESDHGYFGAKEITLDQLDAHLGVDVEWRNGDECVYMTHNVVHQFIGPCPKREGYGYIQAPGFEVNFVELSKLSKPETKQQREERERLEEIETMCNEVDRLPHGEAFAAMATLYDLGYRKQ